MEATYTASIGNDPIDSRVTAPASSYVSAARLARSYAKEGETITVAGPEGLRTFLAVGNGRVWRQ